MDDHPRICGLADLMDGLHRENLPDRYRKQAGPSRAADYVQSLIEDEETFLTVAELCGELVGLINAGLARTPDVPVKRRRVFLKIRGVVVGPDARRQGVGRSLVQAAQAWARGRGAEEAQLNVYDFNGAAAGFFASLGFTPLSHRLLRTLDEPEV